MSEEQLKDYKLHFYILYDIREDNRMSGGIYLEGRRVLSFDENDFINKHFFDIIPTVLNKELNENHQNKKDRTTV